MTPARRAPRAPDKTMIVSTRSSNVKPRTSCRECQARRRASVGQTVDLGSSAAVWCGANLRGKGEGRLSAALDPGSQRWIWQRRFLPGPPPRSSILDLSRHDEARRPAARNARPLRSAMAIPQWVSGTRLYPLVPPLPVLLESVTSGPPPFRGKTECIPAQVDDGKPHAASRAAGRYERSTRTTTMPSSRTRTG